jgi:alpha-galactosidase
MGGMSLTEYKSQMSLWSILMSPLILSCDLRNISKLKPEGCFEQVIKNKEVIAVNQDKNDKQGRLTYQKEDVQVFMKPLADGSRAIVVFNRGHDAAKFELTWEMCGLAAMVRRNVRDLWAHKNLGTFQAKMELKLEAHASIMYILRKV